MKKTNLEKENEFKSYHPLISFIYFCIVIGISMFSMNPVFLGLSFVSSWVYSIILKGKKAVKFNICFCIPIIIIMTLINGLSTHNGMTILFYLNNNAITLEAILYGLASSVMLCSVIIWFSCYNVVITSDKIIYLFGRIAPVLALTISMCFRFIPLLKNRFKEINQGQKCMGRDISSGSIIFKIRQFFKQVSILIAWSLEEAIETSDSMEARGYGLKGRTSFHLYHFEKRDLLALIYILIVSIMPIISCITGKTDIYYYPKIVFTKLEIMTIISMITYLLLLLFPVIIEVKGARKWKKFNLEM